MLTLRQRIFLISGITISVILVIVLFLVYRARIHPEDDSNTTQNTTDINVAETGSQEFFEAPDIQEPTNVNPDELLAKQISRIFVERFATYSNQNDNSHIQDALLLATNTMQQWIRTQSQDKSNQYKGVTTRVLSSAVTAQTDTTASVAIAVQQEQRSAESSNVVQKKGRVDLTKIGNMWFVDGFFWD